MLELAYEWEGKTKEGEGKGGKEKESLRKNLDFEAILVKFQQKWGVPSPKFPTPLCNDLEVDLSLSCDFGHPLNL